jgi:YHS domain-containing protein
MLFDEAPPPKPKVQPWEKPVAVVLSAEDDRLRASLPFSPAIAMDPIDGSKISMRATTPTFEYKGRIYYFSSEANRKTFMANPDQYLTGRFTQL